MTISFDKVSGQQTRRVMIFFSYIRAWSRPTHVNYIIIIAVIVYVRTLCVAVELFANHQETLPSILHTAARVIMKI